MSNARNIVIVESPAKAKTINKYLGDDYFVTASFGHIRDLPSKNGSVDPDNDFDMIWEVSKDSTKRVSDIVKMVKEADKLILSTDPDREGEAISWHLLQVLNDKKALKNTTVERVTFNEITKTAILKAMENPREIDQELVDAYLARRALDYLVGFNLSPVLWRKLPGARSAGRVQSVALRLITEREQDIEAFIPTEYWSIDAALMTTNSDNISAHIVEYAGNKLKKLDIQNKEQADQIVEDLKKSNLTITNIEAKPVKRNPAAPFITSTLQQEASRKLGFVAAHTMSVAQKLYEDGLITYMRTDGVTLSSEAISSIRSMVGREFGDNYVPSSPRIYKSKAKNAQEAHEAIRPTDITKTPESLKRPEDQIKLYRLIRNRTLACQMEAAVTERTTVTIFSDDKKVGLRATGSVIVFDGFLRLYREGLDDAKDEESRRLPKMNIGEALNIKDILPAQHFTEPAPRFSEASLVKKMEELGIGRPSTYASVISVLKDRDYVVVDKGRFVPNDKGRIVTCFLEDHFSRYVEYDFTADLEEKLDVVTSGTLKWRDLLREFWTGFKAAVDETTPLRITEVIDRLNEVLGGKVFPKDDEGNPNRSCPACNEGTLSIRLSKYGAFVGCSRHPDCGFTRSLDPNDEGSSQTGPEIIGQTSEGEDIAKKVGRFGPYLEVGSGKTAKRAGIPKFYQTQIVDEELARKLLSLPRIVGQHPETGEDIITGFGRFGAYIAHDGLYAKLPSAEDVLGIGLNHAVVLLAEKAKKGTRKKAPTGKYLGKNADDKEIFLKSGRYGPYVTDGKINATLPKDTEEENVTLEQAIDLIEAKAGAKGKTTKKKAEPKKKAAAKKPAAKKTTAKKTTAKKEPAKKTGTKKATTKKKEE